MHKEIVLKAGREKSVLYRHPWIFSGAIKSLPQCEPGEIAKVMTASGEHLGYAYINTRSQITARMISFDDKDPYEVIREHIKKACAMRKSFINTTALRLVNAEGDFLPGLIVDQYNKTLVIQISTIGMEKLKDFIVDVLEKECRPDWIVEVSTSPSRKIEGLSPTIKTLKGQAVDEIEVQEGSLRFLVSPLKGQKTGFFSDLREMRFLIQSLSKDKRVLNLCSYTGAFSCHALLGGAKEVVSVDVSKEALDLAERHVALNGFEQGRHKAIVSDVFDFIQNNKIDFDIVILDPPAFAKQKKDIPNASKAYRELNRMALSKMPNHSLLLTCSCSYHVDELLFRKLLFQAATSAKRDVQILGSHRLAFDHPINLAHQEGSYLKCFLCHIY